MSHRHRLRTILVTGVALGALAVLPGCVALVAGAAGAGTGYALGQERDPATNAKDIAIRSEVSQSWAQYNFQLARDLDATVYNGRVLLTGRVPSEDWRQEAVKRTWKVDGVKEVYDEIAVGPDEGTMQDARDTLVTTRLRAELLGDPDIRSLNYTITTVSGTVYVIGSARSQAELNRVTDHARNLANVRRVVSYVRIRPGEAARPATAAAPAPTPAAASRSADTAPAASGSFTTAPPVGQPTYVPPAGAASSLPDAPTPPNAPTPRRSIEVTPLQ